MQTILVLLLGVAKKAALNIFLAMASWKFIKWQLKMIAESTKNGIDNNTIELVDAAYEGNIEDVKKYAEAIIGELKNGK